MICYTSLCLCYINEIHDETSEHRDHIESFQKRALKVLSGFNNSEHMCITF